MNFRLATNALFAISLVSVSDTLSASDIEVGRTIFAEKCAGCHGSKGEGVEGAHATPLTGDRSVRELAAVIAETMPKDSPGDCVSEDALSVAEYIHNEFYSEKARLRNALPRVELSRLTVRQYRNSIADVFEPIRGRPEPWGDQRGLRASFLQGEKKSHNEVHSEVTARVAWDLGEASPAPDKITESKWSVQFRGSLFAPETGIYEISMETRNSVELWLNDDRTRLIDGSVRSGEVPKYTATIFLLGGRSYPIRIQWRKFDEKTASFSLTWKRPKGVEESIPARYLSPTTSPEALVVATVFPPDDGSVGYERGASLSKEWEEAVTAAAIEIANKMELAILRELGEGASDSGKVKDFCARIVETAFRGKLSEADRLRYVDSHFAEGEDARASIKKVMLLCLKSPRFLYPAIPFDGASVRANHLALALWDSLPDLALQESARSGSLNTPEGAKSEAERMADDPRTKAKLREFFDQWLGARHLPPLSKDASKYPEFNEQIAADLRTSLDLFLREIINDPDADLRRLLAADHLYLNGRLAQFYGIAMEPDADWRSVSLPERSGVLSHPYLMSGFAYYGQSSPIHRGVFLTRSVLGRTLRPPPVSIAPLAEELHPDLTMREKVTIQTQAGMCQTCHRVINALGFTLEHYDAVGRYRLEEKGKGIDASGMYLTTSGEEAKFRGVRELAEFLENSEEVQQAFARQLFQFMMKQPATAYGADMPMKLRQKFAESGFRIRPLLIEVVLSALPKPPDQAQSH